MPRVEIAYRLPLHRCDGRRTVFCRLLLLAISTTMPQTRSARSRTRAPPTWITSIADTYALERRVDAVEAMAWQRDADLLCGRWELLATTQARGAGLLRAMAEGSALGRVDVFQDIRRDNDNDALRLDNVITISRDDDGWRSAWTLLAPKTRSSLVLKHAATVEGTRVRATLDGIEVDGTRVGEAPQTIAALPLRA